MGLSTGWGDVYGWYRPGNYVELGANANGLFVVRAIVDPEDNVAETNERDNTSYALVRVDGTDVSLVERGRGTDPWDPHKVRRGKWWN